MKASLCRERGLFLIANKLVSVITLIFFSAGTVFALPAGQQVVNGQASFITQSNNLMITSSPNAIINWQGFSINNNEAVRFIQQYSTSSVMNRVIGQDPSRILGLLQSNGRVFLINPNGILFGQGARIDVNGLFASTLAISNQDFLAGKFNFTAGVVAGSIQNQGTITTPEGGKVYLIAPDIENSGIINSPQGEVLLAAGHSVQLVDSLNPDIAVVVSAPENKAVNLGQIVAQSGKVGIYGGLISQRGIVNADSAVKEGGRIFLKATKSIDLADTSVISANGPQGGQIKIQSESGTALVSGTVTATGNDGKGGDIQLLGNHVGLVDNAQIDASGKSGGGTVLIGGDYKGQNPAVPNAEATYVGNDAVIRADATETGDGGKVIVWSDNTTRAYGSIYARGGAAGGNGGFVETSGKQYLDYQGVADLRAPKGVAGTILLDPTDITISAAANNLITLTSPFQANPDASTTTSSTLNTTTLQTQLGLGNVSVTTASSGIGPTNGGSITVSAPVTWNINKLTLSATTNISINAALDGSGTAQLALEYGQGAPNAGNLATYSVKAPVNLPAGPNFSTKLGSDGIPVNFTVITSLGLPGSTTGTDLQGMNGNLAGDYALGSNIDASTTSGWNSGAGFVPVSTSTGTFTGTFDGLGHTITDFYINRPTDQYAGLFGNTGSSAIIRNVGMVNGNITGRNSVGGLVGLFGGGSISNAYSTGAVTGDYDVGGLVGYNDTSSNISNSYSTGTVSGPYSLGGLVGNNYGNIENSYSGGAVTGGTALGGLVGINVGTIINSYSTGAVNGTTNVGGLVGYNDTSSTISNSYSTGAVAGSGSNAGGLVGYKYGGSISNSYWDTTTAGVAFGIGYDLAVFGPSNTGATPLTTAQMMQSSNFSGFDFGTPVWWISNGNTRPFLSSEYSNNITNAHQLQLMGMNATTLGASYTLASNIDMGELTQTSGLWNTTTRFLPVGGSAYPFTGTFDGLSHTITDLKINRSSTDNVGLFGYTNSSAIIRNVGLVNGNITGQSYVGGLVGHGYGGLSNSYSTATVIGSIPISNDYVGGLVGYNDSTGAISNSYHIGAVTATASGYTASAGGLAGMNYGSISNSYSTGAVTASGSPSYAGGLAGSNYGSISNSFWDTETSLPATNSVGTGTGTTTGVAGLTTALMKTFSSFSSVWDIANIGGSSAVWRIYNGNTYPLLRSFLTPATVTASDAIKTYDGNTYSGGNGVTCSTGACNPANKYWGTVGYGGDSQGAINAASYTITPSGYYSDQQGYDIVFANGALTINPYAVSMTGSRTYDGTADVAAGIFTLGPLVGTETLTPTGAGTVADKNVGTAKPVTLGTLALVSGTGLASNYTFSGGTRTVDIAPAAIANVTGITANNKTYDGTPNATLVTSAAGFTSMIAGDSLNVGAATGAFSDKNAGAGKTVNISGIALGGADAGNYTLTSTTASTTADIAKAAIANVTGITANNKTYDGTPNATLVTSAAGFTNMIAEDNLNVGAATGAFSDKNAGAGKTVSISGIALGGADAGNYTLTSNTASTTADIAKAAIANVTGITANNKPYDGTTDATLVTSAAGFTNMIAGDNLNVSAATGAFSDKNAGAEKTVNISGIALGGVDAGNYTLTSNTASTTATIEPGQIVSGMLDVAAGGKTIYFVVNGTLLSDSASTTESGNYSGMLPLIPNNSALLAYVYNDSSVKSASVYLSTGGDITDLLLSSNTVTAGGGGTMSNATFGTAKGALSSSDIPYSVSGTNLTLSPNFNFKTASGTTYKIDGNITTTNGAHTYNGPVTLLGNAVLSAGTGNISFGGAVTGTGYNFTLNSQGTVTQTAPISVSGLELLGTGGTYNLTDAGNAVTTLAGNTGTVNFTNSTGLSIDTVNTTTGMTTSGSVALNATGAIGLNGDVLAAGGIEIHAGGDGDVRQYAGNIANTIAGSTTPGGYDINISGHDVNLRSVASQRDIDVTAQSLTVGNVQALGLQGFHVDDEYFTYLLPFSFSFYGTPYTTAYISSNGIITFGSGTSAYTDSTSSLQNYKIIASAWNDWDTRDNSNFTRPLDVYVSSAAGALGVRWDVARYPRTSQSAQFETVLYNNGNIKFNYGPANYSFSGDVTIGLSNQSSASTLASQLMSQPNFSMNNMQSTTFSYASEAGQYSETLSTGSDWNASMTGSGTSSITSLGNITLNSAAGIAINGAVNAGSNKLKLVGAGTVSQMAPITAAGLELLGAGATYNLTHTDNAITTLAGNTGTVNFTNSTGLDIGTVNTAGLATSGDLTLNSGGAITQSAPLQVVGVATFGAGATNDITLTNAENSFSSVGITSGKDVSLTNTGALVLNASTASNNLSATAGGDITLNGLVTATGAGTEAGTGGNVTLHSGGAIINGMGSSTSISAGSLFAEAVNGIGSGDPLMTGVNNVTALNTTANNIEIDNTGVLTVSDLKNLGTGNVILQNIGGITTETSPVTASGGSVSMTAHSPLTIGSGGVTASGSISLEASSSEGGSDNLTINGSIASANGSIILTAGSDIVLGPGGTLSAPNGTITLNGTSSTGAGNLAVTGNETATDNTVSSLEKGDDEDERRKKIRERGEQTSDDKKTDDVKKYCN